MGEFANKVCPQDCMGDCCECDKVRHNLIAFEALKRVFKRTPDYYKSWIDACHDAEIITDKEYDSIMWRIFEDDEEND